jgi:hypothetical protein
MTAEYPLDRKTREQWLTLSAQTVHANAQGTPSRVNELLNAAERQEPQSPVAPAYRLWIADNLAREGRYLEAIRAFDAAVHTAEAASSFLPEVNLVSAALRHKAQAATLGRDTQLAIATYRDLARRPSDAPAAALAAGEIAERQSDDAQAAELYGAVARGTPSVNTDEPAELARRALLRLKDPATHYFSMASRLMETLTRALEETDTDLLEWAASRTHFASGVIGGHTAFDAWDLIEHLNRDLRASSVTVQSRLLGSGEKRYLMTRGWAGDWFRGDVCLLLTRAPKGWQWTGVAVSEASDPWQERWRPATRQENQPLPFPLLAPWPAGVSFTAGGLGAFVAQQLVIVAAGPFVGGLLALAFARNRCGFGPRGFYYNQGPTHDEADAFAIDFTRYRRNVPYDNESEGTPVLAVRGGIVARVDAGVDSGSSTTSNTVEITHEDPANPSDLTRFRSRYLHLAGPFQIPVSVMMPVITGQRLGLMDDTGNSRLHHLHFSIHDRDLPHPDESYGRSVRPSPMSGATLGDAASGRCVRSTNLERVPGLNFRPRVVSFGTVAVGDIRTRVLTIENTAGIDVTATFPASTVPPFAWPSFNQTIPHGESRTVVLQFSPVANGLVQKTISISSNAPGSPHTVKVSGRGLDSIEPS